MRDKSLKRALFLVAILLFSGCAQQAVQSESHFWNDNNSSVLIVQHVLPDGGEYVLEGPQALLDAANGQTSTKQLIDHLDNQKADSFFTVGESFKDVLEEQGYNATLHSGPINFGDLSEFPRGRNTFDYRLTELFNNTNADYILINQLEVYGAHRSYYGVALRNPPNGYAVAKAWLIDRNHKIIWYSGDDTEAVKVSAPRPWEQPPDFPNVTNWMQRAVTQSQQMLVQSLINQFRADIPLR